MARRTITQAKADKIRKDYEALIEGRTPTKTLDDIQAKYGVARTTIYALKERGWDVMAGPPRAGTPEQLAVLQEGVKSNRARLELLEDEVRSIKTLLEGLVAVLNHQ